MENIENSHDCHMMEKSDGILEVTCLYRVYDDGTFLPCSYASLFVRILSNYGKGLFFCLLLKSTGLWWSLLLSKNLCIVVQKKSWKKIGRCWNFVLKSITFQTQWFRYAMINVVHENFLCLVKCELFASGLSVFKLWSGRRHLHDSFNKQSDWRVGYYWEGLGSSWTFVGNLCSGSYGRNFLIQLLMK